MIFPKREQMFNLAIILCFVPTSISCFMNFQSGAYWTDMSICMGLVFLAMLLGFAYGTAERLNRNDAKLIGLLRRVDLMKNVYGRQHDIIGGLMSKILELSKKEHADSYELQEEIQNAMIKYLDSSTNAWAELNALLEEDKASPTRPSRPRPSGPPPKKAQ